MTRLRIDVWSDVACPWCYLGKRRLERALEQFPERDQVELLWHAFELDPRAPRDPDPSLSHAAWLAAKYGISVDLAGRRIAQLADLARRDGLDFDFEKIKNSNTFDAHRLVRLALLTGKQDKAKERFMRAYFCEGELVSSHETLARLAGDVGLDADEVKRTLEGDAHADEVRADEREASELGIRGVPFFVFGERYAVSGAQPTEVLLGALHKAWDEIGAGRGALPRTS